MASRSATSVRFHGVEHRLHLGGALPAGHVEEPGEQRHVLPPGQRAVGRQLLRHVAEQAAHRHRLPRDVQPEHRDRAGRGRQQRGDQPDRGGLARRRWGRAGRRPRLPRPPGRARRRRPSPRRRTAARRSAPPQSRPAPGRGSSARARRPPGRRRRRCASRSSASPTSTPRADAPPRQPLRAASVSVRRAARRSAGSTARCTIPAATSWLTSVLTVLPARCRLRAAAATPTPGSASTSCSSSSCAPRSAARPARPAAAGGPPDADRAPRPGPPRRYGCGSVSWSRREYYL